MGGRMPDFISYEHIHLTEEEQAFLLIPVGYPREGTHVPDIHRKPFNEVILWR